MMRALFACFAFCWLGACGVFNPRHTASIAGAYQLVTVDGQVVPCCTRIDTTSGVRTTPLGGQLTLGDAAPESFVATPAGVSMPSSCVYTIPNGARVHADTVFKQDGSWYLLPPCGRGSYAMTITDRVDSAGRTDTATVSYAGRYSWSNDQSAIYLVGSMSGSFTRGGSGVEMSLQQTHIGVPPAQDFPTYAFASRP